MTNYTVHIIGFAKIVGDISDGAKSVVWFFLVAFIVTAILLYLYSRSIWLTVLPLTCSFIAVIWQMGTLSLMGYSLDPMNILTPFLIFAIGVSHGVQKISAWIVEKEFGGRTPDAWAQDGVTDVAAIPRRSADARFAGNHEETAGAGHHRVAFRHDRFPDPAVHQHQDHPGIGDHGQHRRGGHHPDQPAAVAGAVVLGESAQSAQLP